MGGVDRIVQIARQLASGTDAILTPVAVLQKCRELERASNLLHRTTLGRTDGGHEIEAYRLGNGKRQFLLYAFPDPGEAVGGTLILCLLKSLLGGSEDLEPLDATWHFIPCLNFDDQPDNGQALGVVFRDASVREVDWCIDNPRPETSALLRYADTVRPSFTFALHDEYHCGKPVPAYIGASESLEATVRRDVAAALAAFDQAIDPGRRTQGTDIAFVDMTSSSDYPKSTFACLSQYGLVFVCEVSQREDILPADLVAAQLAAGLVVLHHITGRE